MCRQRLVEVDRGLSVELTRQLELMASLAGPGAELHLWPGTLERRSANGHKVAVRVNDGVNSLLVSSNSRRRGVQVERRGVVAVGRIVADRHAVFVPSPFEH